MLGDETVEKIAHIFHEYPVLFIVGLLFILITILSISHFTKIVIQIVKLITQNISQDAVDIRQSIQEIYQHIVKIVLICKEPLDPKVNETTKQPTSETSYNCIFSPKKCKHQAERTGIDALLTLLKSGNIGEAPLKFERLFKNYMYYWLQESMDTTRVALVSLLLLKDKNFINDNKDSILDFVKCCFDKKRGGYSIVPGKEASIYATSNAIEVINHVLYKQRSEKLIDNGSIDELKDGKINSIKDFLKRCINTKNSMHYIYDDPENNSTDSIIIMYLAWRLLWSLNKENEFFELIPKQDVENYIRKCERPIGGFASNPLQKEPSVSATYFALLLVGEEPYREKLLNIRNEFFVKKNDKISEFIDKCWDEQRGGYGASVGTLPSLQPTYFALRIRNLLGLEPEEEKTKRIRQFVKDCYCEGGGFAFSKHFSPKEPFLHATLTALQILETRHLHLYDWCSRDDWYTLTDAQKEETKNFVCKFYNQNVGGFFEN